MTDCKPVQLSCNICHPVNGCKNNNPIIFLHGLGSSKEHWLDIPQKTADATNTTVYVVDARNHGDSNWHDEFDFDINIVDMEHFIEQIGAEKVTLVGHSMGGITSMKMALKMPSKVEKIVVEDTGVTEIPKEVFELLKLIFSLIQKAIPLIPKGLSMSNATSLVFDFVYKSLPETIKTFVNKRDKEPEGFLRENSDGSYSLKTNYTVLLKTLENEELLSLNLNGTYNGPACFIYGVKSSFSVKQDEEKIKQLFPKAVLVGIEGALHRVHDDAPVQFTEALLKFLKDC